MSDFNEILHGKEYAMRDVKFDEGIKALQEKHSDYFKGRKSFFFKDSPEELVHHIMSSYINNVKRIGFHRNSDLPEYIRQDVLDLAEKVWRPN